MNEIFLRVLKETEMRINGVYFLAGDMEVVKIGESGNLGKRIENITPSTDRKLELIGFIKEDNKLKRMEIETSLHRKFKHLLKKGEWFYLTNEIVDFIEENDL
jgi:hypothetical protein